MWTTIECRVSKDRCSSLTCPAAMCCKFQSNIWQILAPIAIAHLTLHTATPPQKKTNRTQERRHARPIAELVPFLGDRKRGSWPWRAFWTIPESSRCCGPLATFRRMAFGSITKGRRAGRSGPGVRATRGTVTRLLMVGRSGGGGGILRVYLIAQWRGHGTLAGVLLDQRDTSSDHLTPATPCCRPMF